MLAQIQPVKHPDDYDGIENTIAYLIGAMMHPDSQKRWTSEQALHYCTQVISVLEQTPDEYSRDQALADLYSQTLNDKPVSVEDILRGKNWPMVNNH